MDDRLGAELVQQIRDFLAGEGAAVLAGEAGLVSGRGLQVAAAILMVAVIRADQASHLDEHRVLGRALGRLMGAGPEESLSVVREAEEVLARAEGLFPVVSLLDAQCTPEQKMALVEALWRLAYSDAELHGEEEYLVRKLATLLHLSTADLIETKLRAREGFLREDL